jgi:hypothetical protein
LCPSNPDVATLDLSTNAVSRTAVALKNPHMRQPWDVETLTNAVYIPDRDLTVIGEDDDDGDYYHY